MLTVGRLCEKHIFLNLTPGQTATMTKKYKIVYNRTECIGAGACAAIAPDTWLMVAGGKADLVGGKEISTGMWEATIEADETQIKLIVESADACPVKVIHIIDLETGKQII
jgi:ferredoxin